MKQIVFAASMLAVAQSAAAQDTDGHDDRPAVPFLEEWADRTEDMMRQLMDEFGPGMESLMAETLPRLKELTDSLGGIINYELPEVLPNGDIIIRRKESAPPLPPDMGVDNDPIDL